jgi:D-Tyr-tRNAtyr deacylase
MKQNLGEQSVKTGIFGAMMDIDLVNYGPVTVIIDSD